VRLLAVANSRTAYPKLPESTGDLHSVEHISEMAVSNCCPNALSSTVIIVAEDIFFLFRSMFSTGTFWGKTKNLRKKTKIVMETSDVSFVGSLLHTSGLTFAYQQGIVLHHIVGRLRF